MVTRNNIHVSTPAAASAGRDAQRPDGAGGSEPSNTDLLLDTAENICSGVFPNTCEGIKQNVSRTLPNVIWAGFSIRVTRLAGLSIACADQAYVNQLFCSHSLCNLMRYTCPASTADADRPFNVGAGSKIRSLFPKLSCNQLHFMS